MKMEVEDIKHWNKILEQQIKTDTEKLKKLEQDRDMKNKVIEDMSKNDTKNDFLQLVNSNLQCSICHELFAFSVTINCGHTFCDYCITTWQGKKNNCKCV